MYITSPLPVGAVRPAGLQVRARPLIAPRALSQHDLDALVLEIQGASTGLELDALGRRVRGFSAMPGDPSNSARIEQLRMAMRIRRDQLKPAGR